ncbi:lipase family protein [Nocardia harenae]|uniref:lipase family protein n=1 Tax=Nocardia harenae TaxID=358707 RepID=UPI000A89267A|nr:lipase family protein [Nocardia harenae]
MNERWSFRALMVTAATACLLAAGQHPAGAEEDPGAPSGLQQGIDSAVPAPVLPPVPAVDGLTPDQAALLAAVHSPPTGDPFFDAAPPGLAGLNPGDILEQRDVTATAAFVVGVPIARATLLKYRSTSATGAPSFGTATLIVPLTPWTAGDRPVLVDNQPINSLGSKCTPGYAMAYGPAFKNFATDSIPPTAPWGLNQGFAVLVTDHEGPNMAYAEPNVAAHVILDGIRAVRSTPGFGASRFALGGYSGGAIASHGAAMLLGEYAPELREAVVGAAMGGLVTDNRVIADRFNGNFASGVLLAVVLAYSREHPEILDRMNHLGAWAATSPLNAVCGQAIGFLGAVGIPIDVAANVADSLDSAVADEIFARTDLSDRTSQVPLYIYHGAHDLWIPFEGARELYERQCARGVDAVFRSEPGEHIVALASGFPGAAGWLGARLRGEPAPNEC